MAFAVVGGGGAGRDKLKQYLPLLPASPFDVVVLDEVDWMMGSGRHDVEAVLPFLRRLPPPVARAPPLPAPSQKPKPISIKTSEAPPLHGSLPGSCHR